MANKTKAANIGVTIFLLSLAVLLLIFSVKQQFEAKKQSEVIQNQVQKTVDQAIQQSQTQKSSELPDYESLTRLKKLILVSGFESWTPNSELDPTKMSRKIILNKGSLAKGYIYLKVSLDGKALSQWESIYVKMNDRGGHLFRPQSLEVPKSDKTELLYALNYIPYLFDIPYNERFIPAVTNWFEFFTPNNEVEVTSFISSRKPAILEEIALYYECSKDSDCLLSIK